MPIRLWCEGRFANDTCDFDHRGICATPCDSVRHSFGGRRTLQARPAFDGAPERGGFTRTPDSMDAFKVAEPWEDNGPSTRLFPADGRINVYDMHACYDTVQFHDFPDCPDEPLCESGPFSGPWVNNCGNRIEGGGRGMFDMYCDAVNRPRCHRNDQPVGFGGDRLTHRTAFVGSTGAGGECLGVVNWVCMGDGECVGLAEIRRWSPLRIDWRGVRLADRVRGPFARPAIEHELAKTALAFVRNNVGTLGIGNLERPPSDSMATIDSWTAGFNVIPPPVACGALPSVATLPGAALRGGGPVEAELVIASVGAWASIQFRREDVFEIAGAFPSGPATTWRATVQLGLDIACAARVGGVCGSPPRIGGVPVVFRDASGAWYRPPYVVEWRGEVTPMTGWFDLTSIVTGRGAIGSPSLSNVSVCRALRRGMSDKTIAAKSVAKGGGEIELFSGSARIVRIGD